MPKIEGDQASSYGQYPSFDRLQRPLHVLVCGSGPSGIALAIELKKLPHVTFEVFEKNPEVGGTWYENRYPGAACDVASHAYQYTFASKTDWSRHFAPAEEIGEYFKTVAKQYDVYPHVALNTRVSSATWDEGSGVWKVEISNATGETTLKEGDVFINAGGILNDWKWPDIDGLDAFGGTRIHTAQWDDDIDLTGKSVAVIGSGASGIQVVPTVQPLVSHLSLFVRSPTYILPNVGFGIESSSYNEPYTEEEKTRFQNDPRYYKDFRKRIEQQMNENFAASRKASEAQEIGRLRAEEMMEEAIKSPELRKRLIPKWELGCRRITPGRPYLMAIQEKNVGVIRTGIRRVVADGVETEDGFVHKVDALICATGFDTSFSSRFPIVGRLGKTLRETYNHSAPEAYLGLAVTGFPNYFVMLGPNCPIANGSLIPCIESSIQYIVQALVKLQTEQIKSIDVKKKVQDYFNQYVHSVHMDLVWSGQCNSWYKDRLTGRVTAVWPGSSIHYMEMIEKPRWEDFDIEYRHDNPFMFMGNGQSQREVNGGDLAYYLDNLRSLISA